MKNKYKKYNKGYITLISVLIVGVIGISITLSLLLLGISSSNSSLVFIQSNQARALANACSEEALQKIRNNTTFVGSQELTLGEGICSFTVVDTGVETRTIDVTGTVGGVVRKNKILVNTINPYILLSSWQEVASF